MKAVDLFAGLGGFTAGAELAGASVVWAANHPHVQRSSKHTLMRTTAWAVDQVMGAT